MPKPQELASLWKVAWAGDEVVGQVKSFVVRAENEAEGRLRGYTEEISTHADWRGRGIAGALLRFAAHDQQAQGAGDLVIVAGQRRLVDGQTVQAQPAAPPALQR